MDVLNKLLTALRGAATQAGLAAVDSQAFRIAAQERRDAESALNRARRDLTLSSSGCGASALAGAEETLERIGRRQEDLDARLSAISALAQENPDRVLDGRLRLAGLAASLRPDPEAILLRLRGDFSPE